MFSIPHGRHELQLPRRAVECTGVHSWWWPRVIGGQPCAFVNEKGFHSSSLFQGRGPIAVTWPLWLWCAQPVPVPLPPCVLVDVVGPAGMLAGRAPLLLQSIHPFWLFSLSERASSSAFLNGRNCWSFLIPALPVPSQSPHPCHPTCMKARSGLEGTFAGRAPVMRPTLSRVLA